MKIIGMLLIVLSSWSAGILMARKLRKRTAQLEAIIAFLRYIQIEMECQKAPLAEMLHNLSQKEELKELPFVQRTCERMAGGEAFDISWREAVTSCGRLLEINGDDRSVLLSLGDFLGRSDARSQSGQIEEKVLLFKHNLEGAYADQQKKNKLYSTLGLLGGVFLVILTL